MATLSGKSGTMFVDGSSLADVTSWRFTTTADNIAYASSATGGFRRRIGGARQGFGNAAFVLNTLDPATVRLVAGDQVTLQLNLDGTRFYYVPAIVDSIQLTVDVNHREPIRGMVDFTTDGAWIEPEFG
jgi:hypothetical protein